MPPSIKKDLEMGPSDLTEHDELDDFFASNSEDDGGLSKEVITHSTITTTTSNNDRKTTVMAKQPKRRKRSDSPTVRFSNVETREYERVVGDQDDLLGPPLAIGWSYNVHDAVDVDAYEEDRIENRKPHYELILTPNGRRHLLMNEFGFTADNITQAERSLAEKRRTNELATSVSKADDGKIKERSGSILKRARRKIGKRLSLDRAGDLGSSFMAMSSPFSSVYASAR